MLHSNHLSRALLLFGTGSFSLIGKRPGAYGRMTHGKCRTAPPAPFNTPPRPSRPPRGLTRSSSAVARVRRAKTALIRPARARSAPIRRRQRGTARLNMRWSAHYPIFNRKEDAYRYAFSQHSTRARKLQSYELSSRPFCSYERDSRPDSTLLRRPQSTEPCRTQRQLHRGREHLRQRPPRHPALEAGTPQRGCGRNRRRAAPGRSRRRRCSPG